MSRRKRRQTIEAPRNMHVLAADGSSHPDIAVILRGVVDDTDRTRARSAALELVEYYKTAKNPYALQLHALLPGLKPATDRSGNCRMAYILAILQLQGVTGEELEQTEHALRAVRDAQGQHRLKYYHKAARELLSTRGL